MSESPSVTEHVSHFGWELAAVCADDLRASYSVWTDKFKAESSEKARQLALGALLSKLELGNRLTVVHRLSRCEGSGLRYRIFVVGQVSRSEPEEEPSQGVALEAEVQSALRLGYPQFGFKQLLPNELPIEATSNPMSPAALIGLPGGLQVRTPAIGFLSHEAPSQPVLFPQLPERAAAFLTDIPQALRSVNREVALTLTFTGFRLTPPKLRLVEGCIDQLQRAEWVPPPDWGVIQEGMPAHHGLTSEQHQTWERWLRTPVGVVMAVHIDSETGVPASALRCIGNEVFQGRPFSFVQASVLGDDGSITPDGLDLRSYLPCNVILPALFPSPDNMTAMGVPLGKRLDDFEDNGPGVVLGNLPPGLGQREMVLADGDRMQHCYVIGATGTGKSTLLHNMIAQDIERGHGVALVDPHGDLFQKTLEHVPAARANDVVLLDFSDPEHIPGFNPLELMSEYKSLEANHVIRDLAGILQQMYRDIPESLGPMFWMYMRNVLALLLLDPEGDHTLLEVSRVLTDKTYCAHLVRHCSDEDVVDFWKGTALQATRDLALNEIAPYVVNKFTEFTQNEFFRCVVGQPRSTFNLGEIMNNRKILLVNLSKGLLNAADSSLLGMLLTSAVFREAGKRAKLPQDKRTPFHVYLDEFQNLTSDGLYSAMAECRKYGLALTLSHQDGTQISTALKSSLRANAASKIMFRMGFQDATELAESTGPAFDAACLSSLPDHQAIVRIKSRQGMSPAVKLLTQLRVKNFVEGDKEVTTLIVARSHERYATDKATVKELLAKSRRPVPTIVQPDTSPLPPPLKKTNSYASLMQQAQELMSSAEKKLQTD